MPFWQHDNANKIAAVAGWRSAKPSAGSSQETGSTETLRGKSVQTGTPLPSHETTHEHQSSSATASAGEEQGPSAPAGPPDLDGPSSSRINAQWTDSPAPDVTETPEARHEPAVEPPENEGSDGAHVDN